MIKVSELTGAQLDYWVARAEGFKHVRLKMVLAINEVCAQTVEHDDWAGELAHTRRYSTNWAEGGLLMEKYGLTVLRWEDRDEGIFWAAFQRGESHHIVHYAEDDRDYAGDTPLQAICRAVVRAAFGDEVEEVAA